MNVGILTLYYNNHNFGGLLQAYALQRALHNMRVEAEQICYKTGQASKFEKVKTNYRYRGIYHTAKMALGSINNHRNMPKRLPLKRTTAFGNFEKKIPHSEKVYDYYSIIEAANYYDAFVVGSDQVWNAGSDFPRFCLNFVKGKRKLAYAASLNSDSFMGKQKKELQAYAKEFAGISVREKGISDILTKFLKKKVQCVIDPVFLLKESQWKEIAVRPEIKEDYILCYLLGDDTEQRQRAVEFAGEIGCKLVFFPYIINELYRECDKNVGDIQDTFGGPEEFLGWIENAKCVITDSFHALAFSVVFHKEFVALPRKVQGQEKMNNRQTDFLKSIGLESRVYKAGPIKSMGKDSIDYYCVDKIIDGFRKESLDYLKNALGIDHEI